jgi:triacylglycerol esterase/lipase EstA (alpha/beta hydrolase family)
LVLGLLTVLVVAAPAVTVLAALSRSGARTGPAAGQPPVRQDVAGPVLLVPGYGGSTSSLTVLANRLRAAGKDVTVVGLPDGAQGDLSAQARVLATTARAALARTGAGSLDVVGYSAGGVVARLWLSQDGGAALARRVVTLGSPQHGTALAELGSLFAGQCPPACQQLIPGSALLGTLNTTGPGRSGAEVPAGPRFVSLWSSHDQVVVPPESAVLVGAVNIEVQQVCAGSTVNHTQLPADRLVTAIVLAELGTGEPGGFGAADCARLSS